MKAGSKKSIDGQVQKRQVIGSEKVYVEQEKDRIKKANLRSLTSKYPYKTHKQRMVQI